MGIINSRQKFFCGKGNLLLKKSVSEFFPRKNLPFLNARDVTSAISLSSPAIGTGTCEEALDARMQSPSMRSNLADAIDFDVCIFAAQVTAEKLSQNAPMCFHIRLKVLSSSTKTFMTTPANSRSLMVMSPDGF